MGGCCFFPLVLQKTKNRPHLFPAVFSLKSKGVTSYSSLHIVSRATTQWVHIWVPRETFVGASLQQTRPLSLHPWTQSRAPRLSTPPRAPFYIFPTCCSWNFHHSRPQKVDTVLAAASPSLERSLQSPAFLLPGQSPGGMDLIGPEPMAWTAREAEKVSFQILH